MGSAELSRLAAGRAPRRRTNHDREPSHPDCWSLAAVGGLELHNTNTAAVVEGPTIRLRARPAAVDADSPRIRPHCADSDIQASSA